LAEKRPEKDSLWLRFVFNSEAEFLKFGRYVVEKGYVAIDGTSLTVANLTDDGFEIMLVKYTQENVALGDKNVGDAFNLEVDILSKTMERLLSFDAMKAKLQAK
jgi:riboflavin synthase